MRPSPRPRWRSSTICRLRPCMRRRALASAPASGRPRRATAIPPIVTSTSSWSSGTPALPAAITNRPQFGSPPWNAALQSIESPIARATRRASAAERAPRTAISTNRVVPSPSRTTRRAISSSTSVTARVSCACAREPAATRGFPAAPLASSRTVSFVLVSPSTEIALSVPSTAVARLRRAAAADTLASVTTKTSRVAMCGAIMPAPFPKAATVTGRPPIRRRRTAVLGNASVVVIACAAAANPSALSAAAAARTPRSRRARGTWTPIRPVAHGATSVAGTPTRPAARAVAALAVCSPSRPVHALALPACTSTADNLPPATRRRAICTGAAGARHNVNTPAATAGGFATMSATSGPRLFSPHRTPAKENPGTRTWCARRVSFTRTRRGARGAVSATSAGGTPAWNGHPQSRRGPGAETAPLAPRRARGRSRSPVALLVLLTTPARARVVPPHLVPVAPHGLDLLRLLAVRERHASRLPLAALHRLELRRELVVRARRRHGHPLGHAGRGLGPDLDAHQLLHDVGLHPADHVLEHVVPLLLIGLERVDLSVPPEPDALLQVIHAEEMVLPERIQRLEHDELFQVAHDGRAEELLTLGVGELHALVEDVLQPFHPQMLALALRELEPEIELGEDRVVEGLPVPFLGRDLRVRVRGHQVLADAARQLEHVLAQIVPRQQVAAARIDHLPLLIGDVVVLEEVLADVEVVRLDLLLRVADGARDEPVLDRHALLHAETLHHALHAVCPEDAEEIVLEREVEAGGAGIPLPAAAAAQLVIDAPRLVPLGAEDVEPPCRDHQLAFGGAGLAVPLEDLPVAHVVLLRRLLQLLADLLDGGHVLGPVRLVAPFRRAHRLLVRRARLLVQPLRLDVAVLRRAVGGAALRELDVHGRAALHAP